MITSDGVIIRTGVDEISMFGRVTQGVRVMKLADDISVVSIAKAAKEEEDEDSSEEASQEVTAIDTAPVTEE